MTKFAGDNNVFKGTLDSELDDSRERVYYYGKIRYNILR
ncbi:hypothetical protein UF75_1760 [Desulfosporosinus sp. I2]|nr:hypothetical protein UF75_1760 [Desulfosporosinus sp. I2]